MTGQPLVDASLNEFDEDGLQTRFAISPFGASESRAERLVRLAQLGTYAPDCEACRELADHPTLSPFMPAHTPSPRCRSGRRPHCACDTCF